jgi:nitroreductase
MDLIAGILTRQSVPALTAPGPSAATLDRAFRCAMAAPDHGRLRPWRFFVSEGEGRHRLGKLYADAMKRRQPDAPAARLAQEEALVLRAPMIITAACMPPANARIPEIEQMLAVGAAVQNLCLALHAQGFGSIWRTGPAAHDADVAQALGLGPTGRVVGFIYVGTPQNPPREPARPDPNEYVSALT